MEPTKLSYSRNAYRILKGLICGIQIIFFIWECQLHEMNRFTFILVINIIAVVIQILSLVALVVLKEKSSEWRSLIEFVILFIFAVLYITVMVYVQFNCKKSINDTNSHLDGKILRNQEINVYPTYPVEETTIYEDEFTTAPIETINEEFSYLSISQFETIFEDIINEPLKIKSKVFDYLFESDNTSESINTLINEHFNTTEPPYKDSLKKSNDHFECDEFFSRILIFSCGIILFQIAVVIAAYFYEMYTNIYTPVAQAEFHRTQDGEGNVSLNFQRDRDLLSKLESGPNQILANSRVDLEVGTSQQSKSSTTVEGEISKRINVADPPNINTVSVFEYFNLKKKGEATIFYNVTPKAQSSEQRTDEDRNLRRDEKQMKISLISEAYPLIKSASSSKETCEKIYTVQLEEKSRVKEAISEASTDTTPMHTGQVHNVGRFTVQKSKPTTTQFEVDSQSLSSPKYIDDEKN